MNWDFLSNALFWVFVFFMSLIWVYIATRLIGRANQRARNDKLQSKKDD